MSKRKNSKNKIITSVITLIILLGLLIVGANSEAINEFSNITGLNIVVENEKNISKSEEIQYVAEDNLTVYFIDVGQADSILVTNKEESMLIDAGNNDDGENVVKFIKDKGITQLDYVIGTHPHEDHIGGLDDVINNFNVKNIYMPKIETTTKTFEDVLDAISNRNLEITSPSKGQIFNVGDAKCEVMTDSILDKDNLNLSSIIIRLEFGNNSFLFMADGETENEKTRSWPKTDVLKVGHHGSNTSTSEEFLDEVSPTYGVIMVGKNNTYGLPKSNIVERLNKANVKLYRTDEKGTIEMSSDGNKISITTEK